MSNITNPKDYVDTRVDAILKIMQQKAITQNQVSHVCSHSTIANMKRRNGTVKMRTADKLYQYLKGLSYIEYDVKGEIFDVWHDNILGELEGYRDEIGMDAKKYADMLKVNRAQYADLVRGRAMSGERIWELYKNMMRKRLF